MMCSSFDGAAFPPLWGIHRIVRVALVFGLVGTVFAAACGQRLTWLLPPASSAETRAVSADGRVIVGVIYTETFAFSGYRWVDGIPMPIGLNPYGVSADGSIVVGELNQQPAYWANGQVFTLPPVQSGWSGRAYAVSDDGRVIVGMSGGLPVRWVGGIPEPLAATSGEARGVSADGRVIVGTVGNRAVRWMDGQMEFLPTPPDTISSNAACISADGRVIAGFLQTASGAFVVARWVDGQIQRLEIPWLLHGEVTGISGDGRVVVGHGRVQRQPSDPFYPRGAFIWREDGLTSLLLPNVNVWASSVSRDGRVVVGQLNTGSGRPAFRYEQGRILLLGAPRNDTLPYAWDVSADGRVVVGTGFTTEFFRVWYDGFPLFPWISSSGVGRAVSADGQTVVGWLAQPYAKATAMRWSQQGIEFLPLPNASESYAFGVSPDGSVVVGQAALSGRAPRAFRWSGSEVSLLPDFEQGSNAIGVNTDGRVIVGWAREDETQRPVRWVDGVLERLMSERGLARRCSADGQVIIGDYFDENGYRRPFRWQNGVWEDLGTLEGRQGYAYDLTADGQTIVGTADGSDQRDWRAWRWRNGVMENLNLVYADLLAPGDLLYYALGISPDGRYIVGMGRNAALQYSTAYLLDTWRTGDVNGDGCIDDADLMAVLFAFGSEGTGDARHEDINKNGIVDDADLLTVLFAFGGGC